MSRKNLQLKHLTIQTPQSTPVYAPPNGGELLKSPPREGCRNSRIGFSTYCETTSQSLSALIRNPGAYKAATHLRTTGLAFEYFPAFEQMQHDFHTHEFIEMLFVISGTFRHVTADQTYDETSGGLTILNYNQFHTLKTPNGPVELINLYWDLRTYPLPELPAPLDARLHELIPSHPMLGHRLNRIRHLQFQQPEKTARLLNLLYQEQQTTAIGSEAAIEALFRLFLIELCRAAPIATLGIENFNPRMEPIRQYLETHYAEPVRLEQLCRIAGIKEANLCRQFKKYTGLSTGDYIKQRRLAASLQRLRGTNEKVVTICHECGFSDVANFNRAFRATFGITPSEYRKNPAE
jgi:AraC-like DNA-binding protein